MKSFDLLVRENPNKTGKEIMEIHEQEKLADKLQYEKFHEDKLKLIKDINENGGYYRGRFGQDQYYYYNFLKLYMDDNEIYCDVESLTLFSGEGRSVVPDEYSVRTEKKAYKKFNKFGVELCERVTKKEWDEVNDYIKNSHKLFW